MLIPYHFDLSKGVFWFLVQNLWHLEENHDIQRHLYFPCYDKKQNFNLPTWINYAKDQNIIGTKEISGDWARGNFLAFSKGHLPLLSCNSVHIRYPYTKLTENRFGYGLFVCRHTLCPATFSFLASKSWESIPFEFKKLSNNRFYKQYKMYLLNTQSVS